MTLVLDSVSKAAGSETHIHPTSLTLEKGTMNVLLGPTLSGKTSLMRLMAGLDRPASGRVLWNGSDVTGVAVRNRDVAMVYQQFINYPGLTVYENIASPLRIKGVPREELDRRVRAAAELMKLDERQLDRKPLELSGGQQQRCALARALVKEAGLVLLDEPLANLDYKLREELRAEIPKIFEESGAIFVYATTEPHEALLLGGNTACLWEGRITQFGRTPEVYRRPVDATTARVFSDPPMNFLRISKTGDAIQFGEDRSIAASGALARLPDGRYLAGFRPNHLHMGRTPEVAEVVTFRAEIAGSEITGSESFVHLDHAGERWVALVHGVYDRPSGETVEVHADARHVFVFGEDERLVEAGAYGRAA
jgi:glycerol transport system ATP-binding protein